MDLDIKIFDGKSFSDILREIYENTKKKESQITGLIDSLKPLISTMTEATMLVPLIKEYLEVSVKNDDNLVKLAGLVQRIIVAEQKSQGDPEALGLTSSEREALMQEAQSMLDAGVI